MQTFRFLMADSGVDARGRLERALRGVDAACDVAFDQHDGEATVRSSDARVRFGKLHEAIAPHARGPVFTTLSSTSCACR